MNLSPEVLAKLDALAQKLGVTAQYLWAILVRQARIEAIQEIICLVLSCAVVCVAALWLRSIIKRVKSFDGFMLDLPIVEIMGFVATSVCGMVFLVISLCAVTNLPTLLFNPEYFALQQILGAIK